MMLLLLSIFLAFSVIIGAVAITITIAILVITIMIAIALASIDAVDNDGDIASTVGEILDDIAKDVLVGMALTNDE